MDLISLSQRVASNLPEFAGVTRNDFKKLSVRVVVGDAKDGYLCTLQMSPISVPNPLFHVPPNSLFTSFIDNENVGTISLIRMWLDAQLLGRCDPT